jgi:gamma-glutamylcyclotransferase (GGCT)/AIG2-like uncharacterized protein YtfP
VSTADRGPAHLFAYGTLQPGRLRWRFLEPYAVGHRPAVVAGTIYDSGNGWPIAHFARSGPGIPGTLVRLDATRLPEALEVLDRVEWTASDLLRRITVATTDGQDAWAYHCAAVPTGAVSIAAWDRLDER